MGYDWRHTSLNPVLVKRLRNLNQDLPVAAKNNPSLIAEMIRVAKTYYNSRYRWDETTGKYVPVFRFNWLGGTALDSTYQPGTMYLDCSTFVGLVLRGLTVQDSPYGQYLPADVQTFVNGDDIIQDDTTDIGLGDENFDATPRPVLANETMYPWVMDLDNMYENIEEDAPVDTRRVRVASQLAKYLVEHGRVIEVTPDLSNIQPGDLVFWAQKSNGEYVGINRYEHINNVAICYARESNPKDISVSNIMDCAIDDIDYAGVKQYLDATYGAENAVYKFEVDPQTHDWLMYKRGPKVDGQWTWTYLDVVGNTDDHWMLNYLIATSIDQHGNAHAPYFEIVRYEWDGKYPYKHILIMANNSPECITAPVLELCDTENIAMICRPDLGAVSYGEYARQFADLGVTHIDNLYRPGLYYVNDGLLQGLPEGTDPYYAVVRVEVTQQHSIITSVTQTVWHSTIGKQFVRSQTCFSGKFSPTGWSAWHETIYTDSIGTEIEDAVADAMASYKKFVFVNEPIGSDTTTPVTLQADNLLPAIASNIIVGDAIVGSDGYIAVVTQVQLPNIMTIPTGEGISQAVSAQGLLAATASLTPEQQREFRTNIGATDTTSGIPDSLKQAFLDCFRHTAWIGPDGQSWVDALEAAMYPPSDLDYITAVFDQGSAVIYDTDNLDTLRQYLTVTAHYADSTRVEVVTAYSLSGVLTEGTSTITVSYGGKTATFDVEVSYRYVYRYSQGDLVKVQGGISVHVTAGESIDQSGNLKNNRRNFAVLSGVVPFGISQDQSTYVPSQYYPVRVPPDATGVKVTVTPNTGYVAIDLGRNGDNSCIRVVSGTWTLKEDTKTFEAGLHDWASIACKANSSGTSYTTSTEPTELVVQFTK